MSPIAVAVARHPNSLHWDAIFKRFSKIQLYAIIAKQIGAPNSVYTLIQEKNGLVVEPFPPFSESSHKSNK